MVQNVDKPINDETSNGLDVDRRSLLLGGTIFAAAAMVGSSAPLNAAKAQQSATGSGKPPNILVIFGDDIGIPQISAYTMGLMGYRTPNIDRIAAEGAIFTDSYGQQSCTAGRASFILGQEPFRTGLLTIGMPGDPHGIQDWMPTIADVLKTKGYSTGQFGKNHLGDHDEHLPTNHGFDEFFGNLYHLNAEEEPEGYFYPKDPEFKKKYGPRGVIHSFADGKIEDTGALNTKRMETVDEEFLAAAKDFIDRQHKADKPFFVWFNSTRMHVFTHLKPDSLGKTGKGIHADGMVEHDGHVGQLLQQLDDLGITENTIVLYTTDNGAEIALWPDGAMTMFHGEKGTTWEGGFRIPMMVRWPGVVKPGTQINEPVTLMDWLPTFAAAAGVNDVKEEMKTGFKGTSKTFKVHLDGYDLTGLLKGEAKTPPRELGLLFRPGRQLERHPLERLEAELCHCQPRQHCDGDPRSAELGADQQPAHGSLRTGHGGGRRCHGLPGPQHLAAGADPGQDQGVLRRLQRLPVPDRQHAERQWHQLWPACAAGSDEAPGRTGKPGAALRRRPGSSLGKIDGRRLTPAVSFTVADRRNASIFLGGRAEQDLVDVDVLRLAHGKDDGTRKAVGGDRHALIEGAHIFRDVCLRDAVGQLGRDRAGRNDGGADVVGLHLLPQPFRYHPHGMLGGGIDRTAGADLVAGNGRYVDDVAALLRLHVRQRSADTVEHPFQVDVDGAVPILHLAALER